VMGKRVDIMKAFRIDFAEAGNSKRYRGKREIPTQNLIAE